MCKKTGKKCEGQCGHKMDTGDCFSTTREKKPQTPLRIVGATSQWLKPTSLQDLHQLLRQHRDDRYRLVFGNTGFGTKAK